MPHSIQRTVVVLCLFISISGCAHSPLPFVTKELEKKPVKDEGNECSSNTSCLQIFIMYGVLGCSHAALRVQVMEDKTVFWDPAGGYGIAGSVKATRKRDLVFNPVPTVNEYLKFRAEVLTEAAEIFEFELERSDAEYLYGMLMQSGEKNNPHTLYDTQGVGLFCSYHISEFLERFAGQILSVKQVFFPHSLAEQLYDERPDRVLIVRFSDKSYDILTLTDPKD